MRIEDILEDTPRRRTTTQTRPDVNVGPDLSGPDYQPLEPRREPRQDQQRSADPQVQRTAASQGTTLRATAGLANAEMARLLSRMRDMEADADDPGYPDSPAQEISTEVNVRNLPAVASARLQAAGFQNPDWHRVANLPGNMQQAIRTLGRRLFAAMTSTPTDEILMVANLGGRGPNTHQEVNAVVNFIQQHGQDLGAGDIDFDRIIPGYQADIHQYSAAGIRWLLVQDQFGRYVYSWPESDSRDGRVSQGLTQQTRALPR